MVLWPKGICELQQIMTTYGFSRDLMPQRRKIDTPNSEVDTNTCISIVLIWVRCKRLVAMFCVMGVTIRDQETTCHVTLLFTFSSREISPRYYGLVTKLFHWCHWKLFHSVMFFISADWTDTTWYGPVWQGAPGTITGTQTWDGGDGVQWWWRQDTSHWTHLQWKVSQIRSEQIFTWKWAIIQWF